MPKIHMASIGERYSDDSGWERLIVLDRNADSVEIRIGAYEIRCSIEESYWIHDSLRVLFEEVN